jgi:hypothetical protein
MNLASTSRIVYVDSNERLYFCPKTRDKAQQKVGREQGAYII